jgi:hypothetical protein
METEQPQNDLLPILRLLTVTPENIKKFDDSPSILRRQIPSDDELVDNIFFLRNSYLISATKVLLSNWRTHANELKHNMNFAQLEMIPSLDDFLSREQEPHFGSILYRTNLIFAYKKLAQHQHDYMKKVHTEMEDHYKNYLHLLRQIHAQFYPVCKSEFVENTFSQAIEKRVWNQQTPLPSKICSICGESTTLSIKRRCHQIELRDKMNMICSGHECECLFDFCKDCLANWYWESTNRLQKTFATCHLCRAEFCLLDVVEFVEKSEDKSPKKRGREDKVEQKQSPKCLKLFNEDVPFF